MVFRRGGYTRGISARSFHEELLVRTNTFQPLRWPASVKAQSVFLTPGAAVCVCMTLLFQSCQGLRSPVV